jgi:hypothetical protein
MIKIDLRIRVVLILVPALLGILAQWLIVSKRELAWGLWIWAATILIFIFLARPFIKQSNARQEQTVNEQEKISFRTEAFFFIIIMIVGIFFRLYLINSVPPGLNHDAAFNGLYAIKLMQDKVYTPYIAESWSGESMFHYFLAFNIWLLGPEKLAIRLSSVIIGILTIPAFYFLMRRLFNPRSAIVTTFLFAISGWHFVLSKTGWRAILLPLFTCLALYYIVKAVDERRTRDFILAGVSLGLSLNTYNSARINPFIIVAYLTYEAFRTPNFFRIYTKKLLIFAIAAAIILAPLGWYAINNWDAFNARSNALWIGTKIQETGSIQPLLKNIQDAVFMFNYRGNGDDFIRDEPLLDVPLSVFFVFGLIIAITRWKKPHYFLLFLVLISYLIIGIVSKPNGNRCFGAIIPAIAFSGLFLTELWTWFSEVFDKHKRVITGCLVLVLLLITYWTYQEYLGPNHREIWGFYPETTQVGLYMKRIAPDYEIHAAAGNWPRDALTYLSYQGSGDPFKWAYTYTKNASEFLSLPPSTKKSTAFIVEAISQNQPVFEALTQRFEITRNDTIYYNKKLVANVLLVPPNSTEIGKHD